MIHFNQIWSSLIKFDQVLSQWSRLNQFDPFWTTLIHFDQVWTSSSNSSLMPTSFDNFSGTGCRCHLNQINFTCQVTPISCKKWTALNTVLCASKALRPSNKVSALKFCRTKTFCVNWPPPGLTYYTNLHNRYRTIFLNDRPKA